MASALFARYPALGEEGRLRHRRFGQFPTAIERVHGLVPPSVELYVKREDQASPLYGGNKVRKLELLLANLQDPGEQAGAAPARLLAYGTYGSNFTLATGIYGSALGYQVAAVLYPQPITPLVVDRLHEQLGAGVQLFPSPSYLLVPWARARARARQQGRIIELAPGGSSPLGTLGWVDGGLEIAEQVRAGAAPRFDVVYAALGSGGMVAGLWLGLGTAADELAAVRVVPWPVASQLSVRWLALRTRSLLQRLLGPAAAAPPLPPPPRLRIEGRFLGGGYGHPSPAGEQAMARASAVGLHLEPTYTGKTLAALLADADAGRLSGKRVLFIHSYNGADLSALRARGELGALPPWLLRRLPAGQGTAA
jgi:D-cysteine desulfhydrase